MVPAEIGASLTRWLVGAGRENIPETSISTVAKVLRQIYFFVKYGSASLVATSTRLVFVAKKHSRYSGASTSSIFVGLARCEILRVRLSRTQHPFSCRLGRVWGCWRAYDGADTAGQSTGGSARQFYSPHQLKTPPNSERGCCL